MITPAPSEIEPKILCLWQPGVDFMPWKTFVEQVAFISGTDAATLEELAFVLARKHVCLFVYVFMFVYLFVFWVYFIPRKTLL
jgi:hypothetical protein